MAVKTAWMDGKQNVYFPWSLKVKVAWLGAVQRWMLLYLDVWVYVETFVLHLYSGQRRPGDFQACLDPLVAGLNLSFAVFTLSIDIINGTMGDLTSRKSVNLAGSI